MVQMTAGNDEHVVSYTSRPCEFHHYAKDPGGGNRKAFGSAQPSIRDRRPASLVSLISTGTFQRYTSLSGTGSAGPDPITAGTLENGMVTRCMAQKRQGVATGLPHILTSRVTVTDGYMRADTIVAVSFGIDC